MEQVQGKAREDAAAVWAARLANALPLTHAERAALEAWCVADPTHAAALSRYRGIWQDPALAEALALPPRHISRRRAMAVGGALAASIVAGGVWLGRAPIGRALADAATAPGEIRVLPALPNGAKLMLDTASAVDFSQDGSLHLRAGALRLAVPRNARAILVHGTRMAVLARAGCLMTLRTDTDAEFLAVLEAVTTVTAADEIRQVGAGEGLVCDAAGLGPVHALSPAERVMVEGFAEAWRRFDGATVAEVAAEIARYQSLPLLVADRIAGLRVTGRFRLANPEAALAALEAGLPIQLRRYGPVLRLEEKI